METHTLDIDMNVLIAEIFKKFVKYVWEGVCKLQSENIKRYTESFFKRYEMFWNQAYHWFHQMISSNMAYSIGLITHQYQESRLHYHIKEVINRSIVVDWDIIFLNIHLHKKNVPPNLMITIISQTDVLMLSTHAVTCIYAVKHKY